MNTYRVYILNTAQALAPAVTIAYVQAEKYGPAWSGARGALNGKAGSPKLFLDQECKGPTFGEKGDHVVVAKIDDLKPRNVKLDKKALEAIINDPKAKPEDKVAAMQAMLSGKPAAPAEAPAS